MKTFEIHEHPDLGLKAVKDGWSWPGFFFGLFWLLYKTMWLAATVVGGVGIVVFFLPPEYAMVSNVVGLMVSLVLGINGNGMYANVLASRGFQCHDVVEASNPGQALAFYSQRRDQGITQPPGASQMAENPRLVENSPMAENLQQGEGLQLDQGPRAFSSGNPQQEGTDGRTGRDGSGSGKLEA
ncbi:hypothetical protein HCU01_35540 [Halomonas cupida]|uniref:DUF2628 domain-containing protein n=1 Tax=Halomonas cupida TaxID=44933 RepID=A0A1M7KW10_9GAMM|nr:DUF2628 domain-containing protein [Halomonas cupida]GEN25605.1 hypothetical protein HCU01_35540 [Halomonas cupida]SHM69698.1 Protein of unknown function [Halomonas cupida]